jgi:RNA polymerase sigma factor (sigma-70 family)
LQAVMERTLSDAEVIARSIREPADFRVVFDRHFPAIHRYLRHRRGSDAADDLAAETFVRAFASRSRFRPHGPDARAWLYAIATNLLRDEARRDMRRGTLLRRLSAEPPPPAAAIADAPDPALAAALAALRDDERDVLLLFAWADLSYEEIAAAMGTRVGTVRSRLSRARARLRRALEREDPGAAPVLAGLEGACDDRA